MKTLTLWILAVLLTLVPSTRAAEASPWEAAERFEAEQSWVLAHEAYLALASQTSDPRIQERAQLKAAVCALKDRTGEWSAQQRRQREFESIWRDLGARFEQGRPKDAFWLEWQLAGLEASEHGYFGRGLGEAQAVIDFLSSRPDSNENRAQLMDTLRRLCARRSHGSLPDENDALGTLLGKLVNHLPKGEERAWVAWQRAELATAAPPVAVQAARRLKDLDLFWTTAEQAAEATSLAAGLPFEAFLWRATFGVGFETLHTAADWEALVARGDALAAAANAWPGRAQQRWQTLRTHFAGPVSTWRWSQMPRPDQPLRLVYGALGLRSVRWELVRLEPESFLAQRVRGEDEGALIDRALSAGALWQDERTFADQEAFRWWSDVLTLNPLPAGLYGLRVTAVDRAGKALERRSEVVEVSRWRAVYSQPSGKTGILLLDTEGRVAGGREVRLQWWGEKAHRETTVRLDEQGFGVADVELPDGEVRRLATVTGEYVAGQDRFWSRSQRGEERWVADLTLDRPLYQPGEEVHWRLVVREGRPGAWRVPDHKEDLVVTFIDNDDQILQEQRATLSPYGTLTGSFKLADGLKPTTVGLQVKDARGTELLEQYDCFSIDRYEPPVATAEIVPLSDASSWSPGSTIEVGVKVRYYSGAPLVGAKVDLVQAARPSRWSRDVQDRLRVWNEAQKQVRRTAVVGADGLARFSLVTPAEINVAQVMTIAAKVLPAGGSALEVSRSFELVPGGIRARPEHTTTRILAGNESLTFEARLEDGAGRPVSLLAVRLRLEELRWSEIWQAPDGRLLVGEEWRRERRARSEPLEQRGYKNLQRGYLVIEKGDRELVSDGEGKLSATYEGLPEGFYRVRLQREGRDLPFERPREEDPLLPPDAFGARDGAGAEPVDDFSTFLVVKDGGSLALPPAARLFLTPTSLDRPQEPTPGLAWLAEDDAQALVLLSRPEGVQSLPLQRTGRLAAFTLPARAAGAAPQLWNLSLAVEASSVWGLPTKRLPVAGVWPELQVAVYPEGETHRPQTASSARVKITQAGRPVRGEISLAVVDRAVEDLAGGSRPVALPFFQAEETEGLWLDWRPLSAQTNEALFPDPRVQGGSDDEWIELSAFSVNSGADGYTAKSTLAGARVGLLETRAQGNFNQPVEGVVGYAQARAADAQVRVRFAATAFWVGDLVTDESGEARVSFAWPGNLTEWTWSALAVGADGQSFGRADARTRTDLPLQARLSAPPVLVAGDQAEVRGVLVSRERREKAEAILSAQGSIQIVDTNQSRLIDPKEKAEMEAAWHVVAQAPGPGDLVLRAAAGADADGMQRSVQVREDGLVQKTFLNFALGSSTRTQKGRLPLPDPLDPKRAEAWVKVEPVGVGALIDAIPYLVNYPYGCVEQTLNRFLPAVALRDLLVRQGLDDVAVERALLGRTATQGQGGSLAEVIRAGLERLQAARREDGFGWWPEAPARDLWMTAYVTWGLALAEKKGVAVPAPLLEQSRENTLAGLLAQEASATTQAWALAALAEGGADEPEPLKALQAQWARLYAQRESLSPTGRACLLLAAARYGVDLERDVLLRNLHNGSQKAELWGETMVHWEGETQWCRAADSAEEATAVTLLALLRSAPQDERIDAAARWLLLNRRGHQWDSTRSTAFAVLALQEWLALRQPSPVRESGEIWVEGQLRGTWSFAPEDLLQSRPAFVLPAETLRAGGVSLDIRRVAGRAPLLVSAAAEAWATGGSVKPFANGLEVGRAWRRQEAQLTVVGETQWLPRELGTEGVVRRDEVLQARVRLKSPVDLEYVKVEVPLPGGAEAASLRSGWDARLVESERPEEDGQPVYREAHPGRSVFFLSHLPAGEWVLVFDLRAQWPGDYRTLPAEAEAMYVPEVRGNSDSRRLRVEP